MSRAPTDPVIATLQDIVLTRVGNGWVIRNLAQRDNEYSTTRLVASSPKELLQIVGDWARRQHQPPVEPSTPEEMHQEICRTLRVKLP